jgi:TRAP-type C4-dicarboxylate transport system substrate-binding protein
VALVLLAALALAPAEAGGAVVIKLGTVAPEGSPWHDALRDIAAEWQRISGGEVTLRIYPGGVAGDEPDMLRKMRIGQLNAAALSSGGLEEIAPDIRAMTFPLLVRDDGELAAVFAKLGPRISAALEAKGYKVLAWSSTGWIHFFSRKPVVAPEDLRPQKLFIWGSDAQYVDLLKQAGFQPIPLAVTDLLPSLQTGLVDAFAAPPAVALSYQWFALTPHMADLRWQPLPGATVVSAKVWGEIPAALRPLLEQAAAEAGERLQARIDQLNDQAVEAMRQRGLSVTRVSPESQQRWESLVREKGIPVFVGTRFSREAFDVVQEALLEYRRGRDAAGRPAAPAPARP